MHLNTQPPGYNSKSEISGISDYDTSHLAIGSTEVSANQWQKDRKVARLQLHLNNIQ